MSTISESQTAVHTAKRCAKAVRRVFFSSWSTRSGILDDLRSLGVTKGGVLMVHSALSSLGYVPGGPGIVIESLRDAIGNGGTLVMPTHSWDIMEDGCRTFDARKTESCVGAITEEFRKMFGVTR